jgi:mannose-6-phosphate isomerase-like protein (cupin superfamily)
MEVLIKQGNPNDEIGHCPKDAIRIRNRRLLCVFASESHSQRVGSMSDMNIKSAAASRWISTRPGEQCSIRVSANETNGTYSVVEVVSSPGDGTLMHVHEKDDEHYVILEGVARFAYGSRTFDVTEGMAVTLARNIPHAWCNPGETALRMLVTSTPGGGEEYLRAIDEARMSDVPDIVTKLGVRVMGPHEFKAPTEKWESPRWEERRGATLQG